MNVMDHSGQFWITAFNEVAEQLMGISANDLQAAKESGDDQKFNKSFQDCMGKTFTFQMMAKQDSYNVSLHLVSGSHCEAELANKGRTSLVYDINVVKRLHRIMPLTQHI